MSDHEDHTTDKRATETSTDSGAQNMPSANTFADMFKAALAPVLNQLTNLNENASSVLLNSSSSEPADELERECELSAPERARRLR